MNTLTVIDRHGEVTNVSLQAQIALEEGDTARSAQLFKEAGEMLESAVARLKKASDRDLARFLAATHYYKGGAYQEAARVCEMIRERRVPSHVRHLYLPFLKDVEERSSPDYAAKYKQILDDDYRRAVTQNDASAAQNAIDVLKDHQYILPHPFMAYVRAKCCEILGHQRAATLFYRDAWRFEPDEPGYLHDYLDSLRKEGRHEEPRAIADGQHEQHAGALIE